MLLTSFARSSSNSVIGSAGVSSTGAGHLTISNKAMNRFCHKKAQKAQKRFVVNTLATVPYTLQSCASSHLNYHHQISPASPPRARVRPSIRQSRPRPEPPSHLSARTPLPLPLSYRYRQSEARVAGSTAVLDDRGCVSV